jgi:hypothetical protein
MPQDQGARTDNMVIVAAVDKAGQVWDGNMADDTGLISVFAPGVDISIPTLNNVMATGNQKSGSSHAAAITVS